MKIETNIEGNTGTIRTKNLKNFSVNLIKLPQNLVKILKRKVWRNLDKILYNHRPLSRNIFSNYFF